MITILVLVNFMSHHASSTHHMHLRNPEMAGLIFELLKENYQTTILPAKSDSDSMFCLQS